MAQTLTRFWVSWWSGYYADEGCTQPPFQTWESGSRERADSDETDKDEISLCAVIDAVDEESIWTVVEKHFPDCERRFCNLSEPDFIPGDRFPDFQGKTSLIE